jgi:hypothetical protein
MDDQGASLRPSAATRRRRILVVALGGSLVLAALLTDREPPDRAIGEEPYIPEALGAWFIGFVITLTMGALIAQTRPPGPRHLVGPGILFGVGALLLIPVARATVTFSSGAYFSMDGVVQTAEGVLAITLVFVAVAVSKLVTASRFAVLAFASFVSAFTLSSAWESRVVDGTPLFVTVLAGIAVIAIAATMTLLTQPVRGGGDAFSPGQTLPSSG